MYVLIQEHNVNVVKSLFHVINIMYVSRQAIKTKTKIYCTQKESISSIKTIFEMMTKDGEPKAGLLV